MNDTLTADALDYLLDEMDEVRRAAFEARLDTDPAAESALKTTADALAGYALAEAAPVALATAERVGLVGAVMAAAQPVTRAPSRRADGWRWLWPVAAAILLSLNFWQFFRPPVVGFPGQAVRSAETPGGGVARLVEAGAAAGPVRLSERGAALAAGGGASAGLAPAPAAAEAERVRTEWQTLQLAYDRSETERRRLTALVAAQANSGRGSLVAMELVDPERFARGERKGLIAMVQTLGSEPVEDPEAAAHDGMSIAAVGVLPPSDPAPGGGDEAAASAWSLFDTAKHEGLVTLYQLPEVAADEQLSLWVRAGEAGTYQRVGEIPASLHGNSGTVFVTLDPQLAAPSEVLVTRERRGDAPANPSAAVVLQGP